MAEAAETFLKEAVKSLRELNEKLILKDMHDAYRLYKRDVFRRTKELIARETARLDDINIPEVWRLRWSSRKSFLESLISDIPNFIPLLVEIDLFNRVQAHIARLTLFSEEHMEKIESIKENAYYTQEYLEVHSVAVDDDNEVQRLKRRALDVSNEASYIIETFVSDDTEASVSEFELKRKVHLYDVLHYMDGIMKEMMKILTSKTKSDKGIG